MSKKTRDWSHVVGVRLGKELRETVAAMAAKEHRTISNYIRTVLLAHIERTGTRPQKRNGDEKPLSVITGGRLP